MHIVSATKFPPYILEIKIINESKILMEGKLPNLRGCDNAIIGKFFAGHRGELCEPYLTWRS